MIGVQGSRFQEHSSRNRGLAQGTEGWERVEIHTKQYNIKQGLYNGI